MRDKYKIIKLTAAFVLVLGAGFLFLNNQKNSNLDAAENNAENVTENPEAEEITPNIEASAPEQKQKTSSDSLQNYDSQSKNLTVPFVVQAPFANWKDPIFQNACEEASVVMAMGWLNDVQHISPQETQKQILDIAKWEDENFGYNADTDVSDIAKIFRQKFKIENVQIKEGITSEDIATELEKGSLILVPAFGQALHNPNFTQPGPIAHMLVVTGYDKKSHEFVTNDPGTKRGAGYRYKDRVLFDAIWKYPSGPGPLEKPAKGKISKAMIVLKK